MTYEEAKKMKMELDQKSEEYGMILKDFEKLGCSPLGGVNDEVREMPEYRVALENFNQSFAKVRNYNKWFLKAFKKEYAAERRNRYPKRKAN